MWDNSFAALVVQAIGLDRHGARIEQERDRQALGIAEFEELSRIVVADRPEGSGRPAQGFNILLQLTELRTTPRSPGSTKKDQDDCFLPTQVTEPKGLTVD